MTPDHSSLLAPTPLNSCCSRGAWPDESPDRVMLPLLSVPCVPHCEPQKMMYTLGAPVVTPMPSTPPPYVRLFADAAGTAAAECWAAKLFMLARASCVGMAP